MSLICNPSRGNHFREVTKQFGYTQAVMSTFMFLWAVLVSGFMVLNYRNRIRNDKNLASVDWNRYKLKLSQAWWSGFLWAAAVLTLFYLVSEAGLTR